jgi:hypothetical protein
MFGFLKRSKKFNVRAADIILRNSSGQDIGCIPVVGEVVDGHVAEAFLLAQEQISDSYARGFFIVDGEFVCAGLVSAEVVNVRDHLAEDDIAFFRSRHVIA